MPEIPGLQPVSEIVFWVIASVGVVVAVVFFILYELDENKGSS